MKKLLKILTLALVLTLFATLLFSCQKAEVQETEIPEVDVSPEKEVENTILGKEDNIKFDLVVVHKDKTEVLYKVETTKNTLEGALLEGHIGKGETGADGVIFSEIDGEKLTEEDSYWSFYKNGDLLTQSPANTPVANSDSFEAVYTQKLPE